MEDKTFDDIRKNIIELRNRLMSSQNFEIPITYIDKEEDFKQERFPISEMLEKCRELEAKRLWSILWQNGMNYIICHLQSLADTEHTVEKLMLEIGKLELFKKMQEVQKKSSAKEKPTKSAESETPEQAAE